MSTEPKTEDFFMPEDTDEEVDFGRTDIKPDLEKQIKGLETNIEPGRPRGLEWTLENRNSLDPGQQHSVHHITAQPDVNLTYSGLTIKLVANEAQGFGDACYINADGEAQLGDADAIATSKIVCMAAETIAANATGLYLLKGVARKDAWTWTVGSFVYLSLTGTTTNTMTQTAPSATDDCLVILGV